ncbi:hypothetical protein HPB49_014027 [Dermacentor silvarum]|uniref:Uncharacterized protein n=1 Tax=Dermacentor silvarum TaxID=543639 RepID=A0ACB8C3Z6_DERSI|nr:hypothetical protein HPB49_014027 [Dermacentor silvarum]
MICWICPCPRGSLSKRMLMTVVIIPAPNKAALVSLVETVLSRVQLWTRRHRVVLNEAKTYCVLFTHGYGGTEKRHPTIRLPGSTRGLPFRESMRILGVEFDRRLSFFKHAEALQEKAGILATHLSHFIGMKFAWGGTSAK